MDRYGYVPIAYYRGQVLKCIGIITAENEWWIREMVETGAPSHVGDFAGSGELTILNGYRGDRISAIDYALVEYPS